MPVQAGGPRKVRKPVMARSNHGRQQLDGNNTSALVLRRHIHVPVHWLNNRPTDRWKGFVRACPQHNAVPRAPTSHLLGRKFRASGIRLPHHRQNG